MINQAIETFRQMLVGNWNAVKELSEAAGREELAADWSQGCWETIVEAALSHASPVRLEIYGDGADCIPGSSRISFPTDTATHVVCCAPANDFVRDVLADTVLPRQRQGWRFDRFVCLDGKWYREAPPFDYVLLHGSGQDLLVKYADIQWSLAAL